MKVKPKAKKLNLIKDSGEFLLKNGLMFEINRRVLHPFGLGMGVMTADDKDKYREKLDNIRTCIDFCEQIVGAESIGGDNDRELLYKEMKKMLSEFLEIKEQSISGHIGLLWDYRDDPDGLHFDEATFKHGAGKFDKFLKKFGLGKIKQREKVLGYVLQGESLPGKAGGS